VVQDEGKQKEEKFDFTSAGEGLGHISLPQATLLAIISRVAAIAVESTGA